MAQRIFAALVLGLTAAAAAAFWFFPLQLDLAWRRAALYRGGVRVVTAGRLEGFEKNLCEAGKPCRCVALLHGLGDSDMTWDKVLLGEDGAAPPPSGTRLLALQLPGTGGSKPPEHPEGYAVPAIADELRASLEPVCPQWTVVGNSLGGWAGAWLALRWPEGVPELILLNPAGLLDASGLSENTARVLADPTPEKMKDFAARAYFKPREVPERVWPDVVASIKRTPAAQIVAQMKTDHALDGAAVRIRAKTTVVWGTGDRVIPREVGERLARLIRAAKMKPIHDCGHLPQRECPAAVTDVLFPKP